MNGKTGFSRGRTPASPASPPFSNHVHSQLALLHIATPHGDPTRVLRSLGQTAMIRSCSFRKSTAHNSVIMAVIRANFPRSDQASDGRHHASGRLISAGPVSKLTRLIPWTHDASGVDWLRLGLRLGDPNSGIGRSFWTGQWTRPMQVPARANPWTGAPTPTSGDRERRSAPRGSGGRINARDSRRSLGSPARTAYKLVTPVRPSSLSLLRSVKPRNI